MMTHCTKYTAEHVGRELPSIGVVTGAVIAVVERRAVRQPVHRAVAEREGGELVAERAQRRLMRDAPQRHHDAHLRHLREGAGEKAAAGGDLDGLGLVGRRHAAHP